MRVLSVRSIQYSLCTVYSVLVLCPCNYSVLVQLCEGALTSDHCPKTAEDEEGIKYKKPRRNYLFRVFINSRKAHTSTWLEKLFIVILN